MGVSGFAAPVSALARLAHMHCTTLFVSFGQTLCCPLVTLSGNNWLHIIVVRNQSLLWHTCALGF
jgi:hypothetical protein